MKGFMELIAKKIIKRGVCCWPSQYEIKIKIHKEYE